MATSGSLNTSTWSDSTDSRYLKFDWTATQSIAENKSTITWTLKSYGSGSSTYVKGGPFQVVLNDNTSSPIYKNSTRINLLKTGNQIASGSFTINHNSSGSASFKIKVRAAIYTYDYNKSGEKTFTLDTIARVSDLTALDGTLNTSTTLSIGRKNSSFTDTITYKCGNARGTIATKTSNTSISFTPPLSLAAQNTTSTKVSITYTIETFNGSTSIGKKSVTKSYNIPSTVVPTISAFTLSEAIPGIAAQFGGYVNGKSKIAWSVSAAGDQGSTIKSYEVTIAGQKGTAASGTTSEYIKATAGENTATVTITDSRGRTAKSETKFNIYDYSAPKFTEFSAYRTKDGVNPDDDGTVLRLWLNFTVSSVNNKNNVSFGVAYQKVGSSSGFTALTHTIPNNTYVWNSSQIFDKSGDPTFSTDNAYQIRFSITDYFGTTYKYATIPTGKTVFDILSDGTGICFGGVASKSNTLELDGWNGLFNNGLQYSPIIIPSTTVEANRKDLDDYKVNGFYVGNAGLSDEESVKRVKNAPKYAGTFTLEVFDAGDATGGSRQKLQRYTVCGNDPAIYTRQFFSNAWQNWICIFSKTNGTFTAQTNYTLERNYLKLNGSTVTMFLRVKTTQAITANTSSGIQIATIPEAFRPAQSVATTGLITISSNPIKYGVGAAWVQKETGAVYFRSFIGDSSTTVNKAIEVALSWDITANWNNT